MAASVENFNHKYANSQKRLHDLLRWAEDPNAQRAMPAEMVEELSTALEELHVAAEIMHEQAEQLGEAHNLLERERRFYRELFDLAPDGYVVTDQESIYSAGQSRCRGHFPHRAEIPGRQTARGAHLAGGSTGFPQLAGQGFAARRPRRMGRPHEQPRGRLVSRLAQRRCQSIAQRPHRALPLAAP